MRVSDCDYTWNFFTSSRIAYGRVGVHLNATDGGSGSNAGSLNAINNYSVVVLALWMQLKVVVAITLLKMMSFRYIKLMHSVHCGEPNLLPDIWLCFLNINWDISWLANILVAAMPYALVV